MAAAIGNKPLPHVFSHPKHPPPKEPPRFPPVNCKKLLFINGKLHEKTQDITLFNKLIKSYKYTRIGSDVLTDINEYLNLKNDSTIPSFCLNKDGKGMGTDYLFSQVNDATSRVMICYNENSSKPFSILVYHHDHANNCVYVRAFCADQSVENENRGSGTLLLHDLINAVSDTKIDSIFLNSVAGAEDYYVKQGFQYTGEKDKEELPEMTLNVDILFPDSPTGSSSSNMSDTSIADMIIARSSSSEGKKSSPKDKAVLIKVWDKSWSRGARLRALPNKRGGYKKRKHKSKKNTNKKYLKKIKRNKTKKYIKKY